jgi:dipeptide/tripeptide permease
MKNVIRLSLLAFLLPVFFVANAQTEQSDTLLIQRNEKGKIEFARFQVNESSGRKMNNDTVFLKSVSK